MSFRHLTIPSQWDEDTIAAAIAEVEAHLEGGERPGPALDDRTREGLGIALEVLGAVRRAYAMVAP